MPELAPAPTGGGPDTSQAPPGGADDSQNPGAVQSGMGPDQNRIPPAGAPGAQAVAPAGLIAAGNALMAVAHHIIYLATKKYPPGKQLHEAMKLYTHMPKMFDLPPQDQNQSMGGGPGGMQQAQGGGMPPPGMAPPQQQMGPPPGGLPRGPAPGSTPLRTA